MIPLSASDVSLALKLANAFERSPITRHLTLLVLAHGPATAAEVAGAASRLRGNAAAAALLSLEGSGLVIQFGQGADAVYALSAAGLREAGYVDLLVHQIVREEPVLVMMPRGVGVPGVSEGRIDA